MNRDREAVREAVFAAIRDFHIARNGQISNGAYTNGLTRAITDKLLALPVGGGVEWPEEVGDYGLRLEELSQGSPLTVIDMQLFGSVGRALERFRQKLAALSPTTLGAKT